VLDPKAFKAYDVRGIYPDELDEAGAYAIGRAYVEKFEPRRIAVGRDMSVRGYHPGHLNDLTSFPGPYPVWEPRI
jgi:phosphomannomutase